MIDFKDVKDCYVMSQESQKVLGNASKNFKLAFYVETTNRTFELYTTSDEERDMWMTAFKFIALCSKINISKMLMSLSKNQNVIL